MSVKEQIADRPITLDMKFMLVDAEKTIVTRSFNITNDIEFKDEADGTIVLELELQEVEPLPDVVPDNSEEGGFGTNIANWDNIDVPLKAE